MRRQLATTPPAYVIGDALLPTIRHLVNPTSPPHRQPDKTHRFGIRNGFNAAGATT